MNAFQIILVSVLGTAMLAVAALLARGSVGRIVGALWIAVFAAGVVFAVEPNWTTAIAHRLGISRGTDLLLYLLVLVVLYGFLVIYLKLRRVRREPSGVRRVRRGDLALGTWHSPFPLILSGRTRSSLQNFRVDSEKNQAGLIPL